MVLWCLYRYLRNLVGFFRIKSFLVLSLTSTITILNSPSRQSTLNSITYDWSASRLNPPQYFACRNLAQNFEMTVDLRWVKIIVGPIWGTSSTRVKNERLTNGNKGPPSQTPLFCLFNKLLVIFLVIVLVLDEWLISYIGKSKSP